MTTQLHQGRVAYGNVKYCYCGCWSVVLGIFLILLVSFDLLGFLRLVSAYHNTRPNCRLLAGDEVRPYETIGGFTYYMAPFWMANLLFGMCALVNATSPNCFLEKYLIGANLRVLDDGEVSSAAVPQVQKLEVATQVKAQTGPLRERNVDNIELKALHLGETKIVSESDGGKCKDKENPGLLQGLVLGAMSGVLTSGQHAAVQLVSTHANNLCTKFDINL